MFLMAVRLGLAESFVKITLGPIIFGRFDLFQEWVSKNQGLKNFFIFSFRFDSFLKFFRLVSFLGLWFFYSLCFVSEFFPFFPFRFDSCSKPYYFFLFRFVLKKNLFCFLALFFFRFVSFLSFFRFTFYLRS
jgi:hypothetical protein